MCEVCRPSRANISRAISRATPRERTLKLADKTVCAVRRARPIMPVYAWGLHGTATRREDQGKEAYGIHLRSLERGVEP